MGIFTKHVFDQFWEKTETTLNLVPTFFDKLVYLEMTTATFRCNRLQSPTKQDREYNHFNNEHVSNAVVRLDYYQSQTKRHGADPRWVLDIPYTESYHAYTEEFINAYKAGRKHEVKFENYQNPEPILEILKKGRFDLIGIDRTGWDGQIIGIDGKPMPSGFYFSYIESRLFSKLYRLKPLLEYMQTRSDVHSAKIVEVPYYNVNEKEGSRCIEFYFVPVKEDFEHIIGMKDWDRKQEVFKILDVARFAKPSTDEDE